MNNKIVPVTALRRQAGAVLRSIQEEGIVFIIAQRGAPAAVMIGCEQYTALVSRAQHQEWPLGYFTESNRR